MGLKAVSFCVFLNLGAELLRARDGAAQTTKYVRMRTLHRTSDARS